MTTKLLIALAITAAMTGCVDKDSFSSLSDFGASKVIDITAPVKPLDKNLYIARATVGGKDINVPKGIDAQLFVNQFALAEELKKSNPKVYEEIQEKVEIKANLLINQAASSAFTQEVYSRITVSEKEVSEGYDAFVKNTDWRNGTILVAKSQDKKDMVDFYDRLTVATVGERSKLAGLVAKMTEVIKDGNFYETSSNLSQLILSLTDIGHFTPPVFIGQEWVTFYLKDVKEVTPVAFEEVKEAITKNEKQRKLSIELQNYLNPIDISLKIN